MSDQYKQIVLDQLEASWRRHDWEAVARYVSPTHRQGGPMTDGLPNGPEGLKLFTQGMLAAFPDVNYTVERQEVQGDTVRTWLTFHGTNTGSMNGMPATGRTATVRVMQANRFENGMMVESWAEWDPQDMLRQLGIG